MNVQNIPTAPILPLLFVIIKKKKNNHAELDKKDKIYWENELYICKIEMKIRSACTINLSI